MPELDFTHVLIQAPLASSRIPAKKASRVLTGAGPGHPVRGLMRPHAWHASLHYNTANYEFKAISCARSARPMLASQGNCKGISISYLISSAC